jgi:hypothetical protein
MIEYTTTDCMCGFCREVVGKFGANYLRVLNETKTTWIMAQSAANGFYGMLGNICCMKCGT